VTLAIRDTIPFDVDRLYEQSASAYLELLDESGKPPKITQVVELINSRHPNYDSIQVATWLKDVEFDSYLQTRRTEHQKKRAAIKLLAAEMGGKVGKMALEQLSDQLENGKKVLVKYKDGTSEIERVDLETKDLIAAAKLGIDLNSALTEESQDVQGDMKITVNLKDVFFNLSPERAAEIGAAWGRTQASPQSKVDIIDACISPEE
jgi:hypothetical protein